MQMLQSERSPYISTEKCSENPPYGHLGNMDTSLLQPLFLAQQNSRTFSYKKRSPIRSTVNTANGHILKSKNSRILQFRLINTATRRKFWILNCLWYVNSNVPSKLSLYLYCS